MPDNADPRHGWPAEEVEDTSTGRATADIYGKLFFYLRGKISAFLMRLHSIDASFKLLQVDAASISDYADPASFSRIDVSNISDYGWLGIHRTLLYMVPLLKPRLENPHATLITLFMNAVEETLTDKDRLRDLTPQSASSLKLVRYLPPDRRPTSRYDPVIIKVNMARDLVMDYDAIFDRYVNDGLDPGHSLWGH
jgi:hypothetical protein